MSRPIMPRNVTLSYWIEQYDLRLLRRDAVDLCEEYEIKPGEAALVSGGKYKGARRFQFLINTDNGPLIMAPQTGEQDLMLSLMLRVSEYARQAFTD